MLLFSANRNKENATHIGLGHIFKKNKIKSIIIWKLFIEHLQPDIS